jgi:phosphate:Na+ symporter
LEKQIDIWLLLAGIGIFLFGIYLLEESIKLLSGRAFKGFIRRYTDTPLKGIVSGTLATAILQSSSAVMLMILAFAGAGIMSLGNAIGVIFGSNLGTTLTSWIVATIGFKIKIEALSLPIIGIGGLGLIFLGKSGRWANISKLLVGFGFLFMGLDYMKESIDGLASQINFAAFNQYHSIFFLFAGFLLTAIVQSSSAAMAIVLSLLFSSLIKFEQAAAMVIGTNLGTTITVFIGSINGPVVKKQISFSHFGFNLITGITTFFLLPVFNWFILEFLSLAEEPVIALALFHTLFNLLGILLFLPFIPAFSKLLIRLVPEKNQESKLQLTNLATEVPEAGLKSLEDSIARLMQYSCHFNLKLLGIDTRLIIPVYSDFVAMEALSLEKHYKILNQVQIELISFAAKIQQHEMNSSEALNLSQLLLATRYFTTSGNSLKDVKDDLIECADSESVTVQEFYQSFRKFGLNFYQRLIDISSLDEQSDIMAELHSLRSDVIQLDIKFVQQLTRSLSNEEINNEEADMLLRANRGFILSCRQMVVASREYLLEPDEAQLFERLGQR